MLSRRLGYILIAIIVMSSILLVMIVGVFETEIFVIALLIHCAIYFVVLVVFIIDIIKNPVIPLGWVWIILIILAPIVIMIAYTITYLGAKEK